MAKKKNFFQRNRTISTVGIILALGLLAFFVFGLSQTTFQSGFEPYGESNNEITGLEKDVKEFDKRLFGDFYFDYFETTSLSTSKYWKINRSLRTFNEQTSGGVGENPNHNAVSVLSDFSGNDFRISWSGRTSGRPDYFTTESTFESMVTTENFHKRDFAVDISGDQVIEPKASDKTVFSGYRISTTADSGPTFTKREHRQGTDVLKVLQSPATNEVRITQNGQEVASGNVQGKYKIKISPKIGCVALERSGDSACATPTIKKPRFKQQFGCTTEPDEQVYVETFSSGENVALDDLNNFQKFCLEELPTQVISNTGATTDTSVQTQLVDGNEFTVPTGQIWAIQYIGDKSTLQTQCENNEVYSGGECFARTAIQYSCPESSFDTETLSCSIVTNATKYNPTDIKTHQTLEQDGNARIDHIENDARQTDISEEFSVIGNNVVSEDVVYTGQSSEATASEQPSLFEAKFSVNGEEYSLTESESIDIDDKVSLEISKIKADFDNGEMLSFKISYGFEFDRDLAELSASNNSIILTNNYNEFEGGYTLIKQDNLGETTVEDVTRTFSQGENKLNVDTENLEEVRARPYFEVNSEEYSYKMDLAQGIVADVENGQLNNLRTEDLEPTTRDERTGEVRGNLIPGIDNTILLLVGIGIAVIGIFIAIISTSPKKNKSKSKSNK